MDVIHQLRHNSSKFLYLKLKIIRCTLFFAVTVNVSYAALVNLLEFMYYGEVQLNEADIPMFINAGETLQIEGLYDDGETSSIIMATTNTQSADTDNDCFDKEATVISHTNKRVREENNIETVAPKRTKVCHSTDVDTQFAPQHQNATAVVLSFGELDNLVQSNVKQSVEQYAEWLENATISFDDTDDGAGPDKGRKI